VQPDPAVRILLAAILVCLAILIVQGFSGPRAQGSGEGTGRYSVTGIRAGGPMLVRTDSVTGKMWKLDLRSEPGTWVEFREDGAAAPAQATGGDRPLQ